MLDKFIIDSLRRSQQLHWSTCEVQLSRLRQLRSGKARLLDDQSILVQFTPEEAVGLVSGIELEFRCSVHPVGPLRKRCLVTTVIPYTAREEGEVVYVELQLREMSDLDLRELKQRFTLSSPTVAAFGVGSDVIAELNGANCWTIPAESIQQLLSLVYLEMVSAIVIGPLVTGTAAREAIDKCADMLSDSCPPIIVIGAGFDTDAFQKHIDDDRIYYLSRGSLSAHDTITIVRSALDQSFSIYRPNKTISDLSDSLLDSCLKLSTQTQISQLAGALEEAVKDAVKADIVCCFVCDHEENILLSFDRATGAPQSDSMCAGLASFSARTGVIIDGFDPMSDPRIDEEVDGLTSDKPTRVYLYPVQIEQTVIAVLRCIRVHNVEPFSLEQLHSLKVLAEWAAVLFHRIQFSTSAEAELVRRLRSRDGRFDLFRREAIEHNSRFDHEPGRLLKVLPRWLNSAQWALFGITCICLLVAAFTRVGEDAIGPAMVQASNKIVIRATSEGLIKSVPAETRDRVRAGDLLVRFDAAIGESLSQSQPSGLWAPVDGYISSVRVRPGQRVRIGEHVASIVPDENSYEVVAFLPGYYAPQIRPGMQLILRLKGYQGVYEAVRIDSVLAEVISQEEASRYASDSVVKEIGGATVVVHAKLRSSTFNADGHRITFRDGMIATAELRVSKQPLIYLLVPGLKELGRL